MKLMMKSVSLRSPNACCNNPAVNGPRAVPTDDIIMVKATATANCRGRIPGRWKGTVNRIGQKP